MREKLSLNELQLKCLLTILMLLNHLEVVKGLIPSDLCIVIDIFSRGVAPAFAYFAVEGIIHTCNLKKYNLRLFLAALTMEIGNRALNFYFITHKINGISTGFLLLNHPRYYSNYAADSAGSNFLIVNNIFLTLFFLVFGISLVIWGKKKKQIQKAIMCLLTAVCWWIAFWYCEWGVVLAPFMIGTYFYRDNKRKLFISYALVEVIAVCFRSEVFYFLVFPIIFIYNGKRGIKNRLSKFFFYFFYPVHLWIIYIINYCMNT